MTREELITIIRQIKKEVRELNRQLPILAIALETEDMENSSQRAALRTLKGGPDISSRPFIETTRLDDVLAGLLDTRTEVQIAADYNSNSYHL